MHPEAKLVVVGGGTIPERVTAALIGLARGTKSRVVVCPLPSNCTDTGPNLCATLFENRHGIACVRSFDFLPPSAFKLQNQPIEKSQFVSQMREFANSPESLAILAECDVFFFSGGDQRLALNTLSGTLFERELKRRWAQGQIVVSGTSAGLQIMSELALTGDFRSLTGDDPNDEAEVRCTRIARQFAVVEPGFNYASGIIFDQHFIARQRQNRLISALIDHPQHKGVGVDEQTALVLVGRPGQAVRPRVIGDSCVAWFDASAARISGDSNHPSGVASVDGMTCGMVWENGIFPFDITLGSSSKMGHIL